MASHFNLIVFLCLIFAFSCLAQPSFRPKALLLPVKKDGSTRQYLTQINQRTPLVPIPLVVDLGGQFMWVDCEQSYISSTYRPARCGSALCSLAKSRFCSAEGCNPNRIGCNNNTCELSLDNTVDLFVTGGDLGTDVVSLQSTNGKNPGRVVSVPQFPFGCARTFFLVSLANGAQGMVGLGRTKISLPSQFAAAFSFRRKFAVCLSSSTSSNGVVFFGDVSQYTFLPNIVLSSDSLSYTPLLTNPVSTATGAFPGPSVEYFIGVKSIRVAGKSVPVNKTLLSIDSQNGVGGTKISTVNPFTLLESSIHEAVVGAFVAAIPHVRRVAAVAPFAACFRAADITSTRVGPGVPLIELVLQSESVVWSILGANSMVDVGNDTLCLGFVDGGVEPRTAIVIGGHQIENNLLEFDLASSRVGFSSTLLGRQTTCANFNFTSNV